MFYSKYTINLYSQSNLTTAPFKDKCATLITPVAKV